MTIAQYAIDKFLKRELDEWDWLKAIPEKKLDAMLEEFWPGLPYKKKLAANGWDDLLKNQKVGLLIGMSCEGYLYLMDMGTGKSGIVLLLYDFRKKMEGAGKYLIVTPNEVAIETWTDQISCFTDYKSVSLCGTKEQRFQALKRKANLYLINYAGLQVMMASKIKTSKGKSKIALDTTKAAKFASQFDGVIFDEIHKCKNNESLTFQLCEYLSAVCRVHYGLTGTPFGRDAQNLWAQCFLTDRGETLSKKMEFFREVFFVKQVGYFGSKYVLNKKLEDTLSKTLKHRSIHYEDTECSDLPERVHISVPLTMPAETMSYYERALEKFLSHEEKDTTAKATSFAKMRQITSGFVYITNEETGVQHQVTFPKNPKMDYLANLLESFPEDEKIVIFHEYNKTSDLICDHLKEAKIKYVTLNGRTKDPRAALLAFQKDPKVRAFVVNSASGNSNLNLQVARYIVFFESPVCPIIRKQAEKRCWRTGQKRKTFIYDIFIKKSVEERIHEFLAEGKNLFDSLLKEKGPGLKKFFR